jgi:hypothetical protein
MVEISSSDAAGHALPPASIAIDPGASGMVARTFPDKNRYLLLSGPPGGPLGVRVDAYSGTAATAEGLAQLAQQRYADDSLEKGAFADVQLAGGKRAAYSCATGTSQARAVHVLALFPASPGADRGVLLDAWIGAQKGVPGPAEVAGTGKLKDVLGSLKVRFE